MNIQIGQLTIQLTKYTISMARLVHIEWTFETQAHSKHSNATKSALYSYLTVKRNMEEFHVTVQM